MRRSSCKCRRGISSITMTASPEALPPAHRDSRRSSPASAVATSTPSPAAGQTSASNMTIGAPLPRYAPAQVSLGVKSSSIPAIEIDGGRCNHRRALSSLRLRGALAVGPAIFGRRRGGIHHAFTSGAKAGVGRMMMNFRFARNPAAPGISVTPSGDAAASSSAVPRWLGAQARSATSGDGPLPSSRRAGAAATLD